MPFRVAFFGMTWRAAVSPGGVRRVIAARSFIASAGALIVTAFAGCGDLLGIHALDAGPLDDSPAAGPVEGGVASGDAASDADATIPGDAAPDADATMPADAPCTSCMPGDARTGIPEVGPAYTGPLPRPVTIADAGALYRAVGNAQQLHAIYAENDQRVWYFYVDTDETQVKTVVSADLSNWTPTGDVISLGVASLSQEGLNFSVGYANLAGTDVVDIIATHPADSVVHVRTTIARSHLVTPTAAMTVAQSSHNCPMDGPFTLVTSAGVTVDVTGEAVSNCGMDIFQADTIDDGGASWSPSFPMENGYYVSRGNGAISHQLVALGSGDILGAYPTGNSPLGPNGTYGTVSWARTSGGLWPGLPSAPAIFVELDEAGVGHPGQGGNDWSLCALGDGNVHALRHVIEADASTIANEFEQAVYGDGGTWQRETPPLPTESGVNFGVVLVSDKHPDHGMLAAVAGTNTVMVSRWDPGSGLWSAWQLATDEILHNNEYVAGTGCASAKPMIFWVEGLYEGPDASSLGWIIHGLDVSMFLAPDGGH
jgi:hypothetical protein